MKNKRNGMKKRAAKLAKQSRMCTYKIRNIKIKESVQYARTQNDNL